MTGRALRTSFLEFFAKRGHTRVPSSPLVPQDDPTLLFANAGMNQFKEIFLGRRPSPYAPPRAASAQKCLRAGGKHNDLENVGFTPRHHTFFEMLGNFSFGDYFKADAIAWAWEYVTKELGLPPERLYATVFREDDDAFDLWSKTLGMSRARISRLDEADNFWAMGETGPCGPCSEIHYDRGRAAGCGRPSCGPGCECGRFLEIWNLVFMEFDRSESGALVPLPKKNVDTGMGLERVAAILQDKESNFETDLFAPIMRRIASDTGKAFDDPEHRPSFCVIADHLRALAFAIADGAVPSNEGRGYVLRRILRRAVRHCRKLGLEGPYLYQLLEDFENEMGADYPELKEAHLHLFTTIRREEESFGRTIDRGLALFEKAASEASARTDRTISGDSVFLLYDTYGFPTDLTAVMARERGLAVDEAGFERAMEAQRERSRARADFKMGVEAEWVEVAGRPGEIGRFLRAEDPEVADAFATMGWLRVRGARILRYRPAPPSLKGPSGEPVWEVVLDKTPFYAEAGGQVGDTGSIIDESGKPGLNRLRVLDTVVTPAGNAHRVEMDDPGLFRALGDAPLTALVDVDPRRRAIMRNHTATHLLHAALRKVLGTHVTQAGSLVAEERLRFDFRHTGKPSKDEIDRVEGIVNDAIGSDLPVTTTETTFDAARAQGAMALFGEKYGDRVRMVSIGAPGAEPISRELCGGTHCTRTGQIERFLFTSESSVAAGVRRVEAVTGTKAVDGELARRAAREREEAERAAAREADRASAKARGANAGASVAELLAGSRTVGGARVVVSRVPAAGADALKSIGDAIRARESSTVAVLAAESDGRVSFVAVVTDDLASRGVHAGKIVGEVAAAAGGKGGGKATFALAGGKDPAKVDEALALVEGIVRSALGA
jgi:alanyl-tRNA synthetase